MLRLKGREQALTNMYDPARDIFTSSEDAPVDPDEDPTERNTNVEARPQAGESVGTMSTPSVDLKENNEARSGSESRVCFESR